MAKPKKETVTPRRRPPAMTPEARENQLIALAAIVTGKQIWHSLKYAQS